MTAPTPQVPDALPSDAHLSDHEWRLKMAAEGKALYTPGKTDEEWHAEQDRRSGKKHPVSLQMTKFEANTIGDLIEAFCGAVEKGERAFAFLERLHDDTDYSGHLGFGAVCGLCSDAFAGVLDKADDQLVDFVTMLRKAGEPAEVAQ